MHAVTILQAPVCKVQSPRSSTIQGIRGSQGIAKVYIRSCRNTGKVIARFALARMFTGRELSSDEGLMLLKHVDERIGLTRTAVGVLIDARSGRIWHTMRELLAQRVR
jgi:hypothetical protein